MGVSHERPGLRADPHSLVNRSPEAGQESA